MRLNGDVRVKKHSIHPGICSGGNNRVELSIEGDAGGRGKVWVYASSGFPSNWTSFDRIAFIPKGVNVTWITTFLNSWINYGGVYEACGYIKDDADIIYVQGSLKNGTIGQPAFELPSGYYDSTYHHMYPAVAFSGSSIVVSRVDIRNNGDVIPVYGSADRFHISGMRLPLGKTWTAPTLLNSWTDYGGSWSPAGYWKDPDSGLVFLRGLVERAATGSSDTVIFTLPSGYYNPTYRMLIASIANDSSGGYMYARIDIKRNGDVVFNYDGSGNVTWATLDGISFPTETSNWRDIPKIYAWENYDGNYTIPKYSRIRDAVNVIGMIKSGSNNSYALHLPFHADYTQPDIVPDEHYVKHEDFIEARTYGNTGRIDKGLTALNWTDYVPDTDLNILKTHMEDLRAICNGQVSYGGDDFSFTDPVIAKYATKIKADHIREIRQVIDDSGFFSRCKTGCSTYCGTTCSARCTSGCDVSCNTTCSGDCQSGCSLSCRDSCSYNCHTTCSTSCGSGCSGTCSLNSCSGNCAGSGCSGSCGSTCSKSCTPTCSGWCYGGFLVDAFCTDNCWTTPCGNVCWAGCGGTCATLCSAECKTSCLNACYASCSNYCHDTCSTSCGDTCNASCQSTCSEHCYSGCDTECGSNCTASCQINCSGGCQFNCYSSCLSGCYSSCADTSRIGADPGSY